MRTGWNVALQVVALLGFCGLRFAAPGWLLFFLIVTIIGPLLLLVPTVLAIATVRRRVLPAALAAPFAACAGLLLLAGLAVPDFDDVRGYAPVMVLLGLRGTEVPALLSGTGMLAAFAWLGAVVWLVAALVVAHRPSRRPAGAAHPSWTGPA